AERGTELAVLDRPKPESHRAVEHCDLDALGVHVDEAGPRIGAPGTRARRLDEALGHPRAAPLRDRRQAALDQVARRAAIVAHEARPPLAEARREMLAPQLLGLEDVAVDVDRARAGRNAGGGRACLLLARHGGAMIERSAPLGKRRRVERPAPAGVSR